MVEISLMFLFYQLLFFSLYPNPIVRKSWHCFKVSMARKWLRNKNGKIGPSDNVISI